MKCPRRLWWWVGAFFCAVLALGWWLASTPAKPAVSLTFLGYTNRVMRSGLGGEWSVPVALVVVSNRGRVPVELRMSILPQGAARFGDLRLPPQVLVNGLICSSVTNFPGEPLVLGMMVHTHEFPWWTELQYEPLSPGERLRRWLLRLPSVTVRGWVAASWSPPSVHRVRFGPITNVPPSELLANSVEARLAALNAVFSNLGAFRAVAESNGLFLKTNTPPAGANLGGGRKRLEF